MSETNSIIILQPPAQNVGSFSTVVSNQNKIETL